MVNICESLINVVINDKPKMLTGLNQKVHGQAQMFFAHLPQSLHHRQIGETSPTQVLKRNVVNPMASLWESAL
jgi:hypothetical protein